MRGLVDGDVAEVVVVVDADADTAGLVGDAMADMFVFRYSCTLKPSILLSLRISDRNSNPPCLTQSMRSKGFLVRTKRLPFYITISPVSHRGVTQAVKHLSSLLTKGGGGINSV